MLKIADAVQEIIVQNDLLHFGFHHRLLNLSQVARFIRPLVEARTRKEVRKSAVLMSLSRLQSKFAENAPPSGSGLILDKINIHSGLCSLTLLKTAESHRELNRLFNRVQKKQGFITITEGISEITVIIEEENFKHAREMLSEKPGHVHRNIASVGVKLKEEMLERPGVLYRLIQQVALQNISVIEVTSTATEFNIYLRERDVRLAFDSLYHRFCRTVGLH